MNDTKTCVIIEDDPEAREILRLYIEKIPTLSVIKECASAMEVLDTLGQVDIIFTDIDLPDVNGIEFLKTIPNCPPTIVTTAHTTYALEAYNVDVIDYLVKPYSYLRFLKAVNKVLGKMSLQDQPAAAKSALYLMVGKSSVKFEYQDILYLQAFGNYTKIFRTENRMDLINENLAHISKIIDSDDLVRVHKSYIISLSKLDIIAKTHVEIAGKKITIGQSYRDEYLKQIQRYRSL